MADKDDNIWGGMNWGMIFVGMGSLVLWFSIYFFGFFQTILWTIIIAAVIGLIIKLKENR